MPTQATAPCSGVSSRSHTSMPSCVLSRICSAVLRSSSASTSMHCELQVGDILEIMWEHTCLKGFKTDELRAVSALQQRRHLHALRVAWFWMLE